MVVFVVVVAMVITQMVMGLMAGSGRKEKSGEKDSPPPVIFWRERTTDGIFRDRKS